MFCFVLNLIKCISSGEQERSLSDAKASTATIGLVVHAAADGLALGAAGASEVTIKPPSSANELFIFISTPF